MKHLMPWIGIALIILVMFGTIYGAVQQSERATANDPQIQLAEDTAAALNKESIPSDLRTGSVDMESSLASFIIIYDKAGKPIAGSGYLDNKLAKAPMGILKQAEGRDYYAISWQPKSDTRIAAVTTSSRNYYVLAGRNLKEVEQREGHAFDLAFLGGFISEVLLLATLLFHHRETLFAKHIVK